MCSNYQASTDLLRLQKYFGVDIESLPPFQAEVYPVRPGPFVRLVKDGSGARRADVGMFGLLPFFAKEVTYGRRTYNARTETVDKLPSFKHAWARGQRCIIPAEKIYEPNYESGKPVRWAIESADRTPLGIAGLWADSPILRTGVSARTSAGVYVTVEPDRDHRGLAPPPDPPLLRTPPLLSDEA